MTEQEVIEQLSNYKRQVARKQVLETYSVGAGITVSRLNQDDQLQELHQKLRGLPSYMYLSLKEQKLETIASVYLERYPSGIRSQQAAIPEQGIDNEDTNLLKELKRKIEKVFAARGYEIRDDIDAVIDRVTELQDLQEEINRIDEVLLALDKYKPDYVRLLKMRYIDTKPVKDIAEKLSVTERTFRRWNNDAIKEFIKLSA